MRPLLFLSPIVMPLLLASFGADAAAPLSCPNKRLDEKGGPVDAVPIHSQPDDIGICYAIVASELVDAYRFSDPSADRKQITSFLATAAYYSGVHREELNKMHISSPNGLDAGDTAPAVEVLEQMGGCDQNRLFKSDKDIDVERNISDFKDLLKLYQKKEKKAPEEAVSSVFQKLDESSYSDSLSIFQNDVGRIFSHPEFYQCIDDFLTEACKNITIPLSDLPKPQVVPFKDTDKEADRKKAFVETLTASLAAEHPQPIGIEYCVETLLLDSSDPMSRNASCTGHGSLIVGSRTGKDGQCSEVLIRYTKGPQCDPAVINAACDKQVPGEYWVPLDKLVPKTQNLIYLKHP
jgi:hypothetical protein